MKRTITLLAAALASFVGILFAIQPPSTGPATEKRFPPLKVPAGFKATLFACDPLIEYPSVIAAGPKPGAIYVAIDYMTGLGTDGKMKSEIRLVEDTDGDGYADKATVIAGGFNSIQGLAYHDGTLFVMHAPYLTSIHGKERKDLLTGLGLKPEDNTSRLHCANGVVVGHDGWLYLALGDNGVNVARSEGDRLVHNGGAILRCRPDGRDLHVFSTGWRNIYDIALDVELNVFTRDNENDGGTYMIRVCHSFFGADHGYPYHYEERKAEAMPPIGDFGLGSSAGGVCYLEQQFPAAYRGNLFFCEWGKSIVRYELNRPGSGFAPVKELEFATGDVKDSYPFKPTDIVVQRDGTMMVSDYADGQRPKRGRGRIYHIAYAGKDAAPAEKAASPLDSASYFERCEAQAAIERAGKKPSLHGLGPRGRLHAIWALMKIDGSNAVNELLQTAKSDPEPTVRAQAIRAIADLADPVLVTHKLDAGPGDARLAEQIAKLSDGQDPRVVLEAVIALGRLRWANAPVWLRKTVTKPDSALAHAWMQTLRRSQAWPEVVKLVDDGDGPARQIAIRALAERHEPIVVDGLLERLRGEKNVAHRREYADLLARVYKKPGPWKYWGYRPGPRPTNTEAWEKTEAIARGLDSVLADADRELRVAVLKRMQHQKVPVNVATLRNWLNSDFDNEHVAVVVASLADAPIHDARPILQAVVLERKHTAANRLAALNVVARSDSWPELTAIAEKLEDGAILADVFRRLGKRSKGAPPGLFAGKLGSPDGEVRAAAIEALANTGAAVKESDLLQALADKDARVRRAAAAAAGKLSVKGAVAPLLKLGTDTDVGVRLACLDSLRSLKEPRVVPLALRGLTDRHLELAALECLHDFGGPQHTAAIADFARRSPSTAGTLAAVGALTEFSKRETTSGAQRSEIERAIAAIHGANGMLVRWHVSPMASAVEREDIIRLAALGKRPMRWPMQLATGAEGRLALPKSAARFAWTEIDVPAPASVEFLGSSRGGLEVWLNGKSLHRRANPAKFQLDSDRFAATLEKGTNRILAEASPIDGTVEFHLRFRRKSGKAVHEKLTQATLTRTGNAERGRKIFLDKEKSQCLKCHQLGGVGERIGPELTGVGARFSRIYLVESILEPSRAIAPSFETLVVTLKDGKTFNGVKLAETDKTLTLADNQGQKHEIAKIDIDERQASPVSTMPDGLEQRFSEDEFVDLIAFLASQKERTAP